MPIRPVYWLLLVVCCLSTFFFAFLWQEHVPALLEIHVEQQKRAENVMVIVHLTDTQGRPLEGAHVMVQASMPSMRMPEVIVRSVKQASKGCYQARLTLSMPGQWEILLTADLPNFLISPQQHMLNIPAAHLSSTFFHAPTGCATR